MNKNLNKRITALLSAVVFLFVFAFGRIGYIIFSGNYTVSSGYNSYGLTLSEMRETVYDCNMRKMNNNKNRLLAVIRPNEKCLAELKLLFSQPEIDEIMQELSKGYPVVKEIKNYASCDYIHIFEETASSSSSLLKLVQKSYNETVYEKKINFSVDAKGRILDGDTGTVIENGENNKKGVALTVNSKIQSAVEESAKKYEIRRSCCYGCQ
ncbi:MAG: hypothetical protein LUG21_02980 [Clostridiales bacterium]|nr:hypothetical protein [Clostridiales bacterium]